MPPARDTATQSDADVAALDEMLFADERLSVPREWCREVTQRVVQPAAEAVAAIVAAGGCARVVDYGSGSGLAAKQLVAHLEELGVGRDRLGSQVELIVADLDGPWFVADERLADLGVPCSRAVLRGREGAIRALDEVIGAGGVDVVVASMVLHLIPARALRRSLEGIRRALRDDGCFTWSSPDSAPALGGAVIVHDLNRAVRDCFRRLKAAEPVELWALTLEEQAEVHAIVAAATDPDDASEVVARRQIPDPSTVLGDVLAGHAGLFEGSAQQFAWPVEDENLLRLALIPSNLKNLNEVGEEADRRRLAELLSRAVLPGLHEATGTGGDPLALTWAVGHFTGLAPDPPTVLAPGCPPTA